MNKIIKTISAICMSAVLFTSCKKEHGPLSDIKPAIPVTVSNAIAFRPEPTVSTTLAATDSIITIVLTIPAGRKITAVNKVAASTTYTQIQTGAPAGNYTYATPVVIDATGTSATFKTNIREYFVNKPVNATTNPAAGANRELANRFYFMITLDDGTVLISEPVRVLVL